MSPATIEVLALARLRINTRRFMQTHRVWRWTT